MTDTLKDRVERRLRATGKNATQVSKAIRRAPTFVRDILDGRKRTIRTDVAAALAAELETTVAWLTEGEGPEAAPAESLDFVRSTALPVRGTVAAGVWAEAWDETDRLPPEDVEHIHVVPPKGYERAPLFALRVRGRSMDREYLDGDIVIVCPLSETDARENDHVVVLRRRGDMAEATVKELIRVGRTQWALQARSTDPQFAEPWLIVDDGEEAPEIIGVVVGSYRNRTRPPPTFAPKARNRKGDGH